MAREAKVLPADDGGLGYRIEPSEDHSTSRQILHESDAALRTQLSRFKVAMFLLHPMPQRNPFSSHAMGEQEMYLSVFKAMCLSMRRPTWVDRLWFPHVWHPPTT